MGSLFYVDIYYGMYLDRGEKMHKVGNRNAANNFQCSLCDGGEEDFDRRWFTENKTISFPCGHKFHKICFSAATKGNMVGIRGLAELPLNAEGCFVCKKKINLINAETGSSQNR
jgi:hypothetical protein